VRNGSSGPGRLRSALILDNHCYPDGGASRVAIDEAVALSHRGVDVTFVGAMGPVCAELAQAPLKVVCLDQADLKQIGHNPGVALQGLWNRTAYRAAASLLSKLDPAHTIVHLHGYPQALTASPVRCAVRRGFQVVCTLHDFFSACPNGALFDYQLGAPCERPPLSFSCVKTNCDKRRYSHKLYRVARTLIQRRFGGLPGQVSNYILLSHRSGQLLQPYLPVGAKYYPLPNPIEVAPMPPVNVAANRDILAIGRLDIEKGIVTLVEAARRANLTLSMVGEGPLRAFAESSGVCRVTGWLPRQAVLQELERARCLVFPSLWYETYGLVVDEAAARGVPAIVSDISAAAERVGDGLTGWHARAGDAADLARCLEIIRDDAAVARAGAVAYEHFWSEARARNGHADALLAIYEDILQRAAGPTSHQRLEASVLADRA
jgi:glycosyltransferase involved in cell wall biosynthesis